jgi:Tfp pilus assembly protein PilO
MSVRLIIIIIMLVVALVLGFFLVKPQYSDLRAAQSTYDQKDTELASKTAYYDKIKEVDDKLNEYSDVLDKIDLALPSGYSVPSLFYYFQKTAGNSGLLLEDISLGDISSGNIKEINVDLKLAGSYPSLISFLSALENAARLSSVKIISFSSSKEGLFTFELTVAVYGY